MINNGTSLARRKWSPLLTAYISSHRCFVTGGRVGPISIWTIPPREVPTKRGFLSSTSQEIKAAASGRFVNSKPTLEIDKLTATLMELHERSCLTDDSASINQKHSANLAIDSLVTENISSIINVKDLTKILYTREALAGSNAVSAHVQRILKAHSSKMSSSQYLFLLKALTTNENINNLEIESALYTHIYKNLEQFTSNVYDAGLVCYLFFYQMNSFHQSQNLCKLSIGKNTMQVVLQLERTLRTQFGEYNKDFNLCKRALIDHLSKKVASEWSSKYLQSEVNDDELKQLLSFFSNFMYAKKYDATILEFYEDLFENNYEKISLDDKAHILLLYAKNRFKLPQFTRRFEKELLQVLADKEGAGEYKAVETFAKNSTIYAHLMGTGLQSDQLITPTKGKTLNLRNNVDLLWILAKCGKVLNRPLLELLNKNIDGRASSLRATDLIFALHARCMIDAQAELAGFEDFSIVLNELANKLKTDDSPMSKTKICCTLYQCIVYLKARFPKEFNANSFFTEECLRKLKNTWFRYSLKRVNESKEERLIGNHIETMLREINYKGKVIRNKLVDHYFIDVFIEPNICVEINGNCHFAGVAGEEANDLIGNFKIKVQSIQRLGYRMITLNSKDFEQFLEDETHLREYLNRNCITRVKHE